MSHPHESPSAAPLATPAEFLADLPADDAPYAGFVPAQPIVRELRELIDRHGWASAFERAIAGVGAQHLPELSRIRTLPQFLHYLDALVTWVPGLRVWSWQGGVFHERTDYLRVTQFYLYFNQPALVALQSPIAPVAGEALTPLSRWLRDFACRWGEFLDTPASAARLSSYRFAPEYAHQDYDGGEDGLSGYRCFNDWFSRRFRDIDRQRPVASPHDPRVIVFPAESTFVGQWTVSTAAGEPLPMAPSIVVKHVAWPIPELLADSPHAAAFEGGLLVHSFLDIFDYHRQHAPAAGTILEARFIPGLVHLDVAVERLDAERRAERESSLAQALVPPRHLSARDATGYQFVQCRALIVLETAIGRIAMLPIGMAQVSSVAFVRPGSSDLIRLSPEERQRLGYEEQVAELNRRAAAELVGRTVRKGEMLSTFLFGGSDIVLVFERRSCVTITAQVGVHYPVRSQIAVAGVDPPEDAGGSAQIPGG